MFRHIVRPHVGLSLIVFLIFPIATPTAEAGDVFDLSSLYSLAIAHDPTLQAARSRLQAEHELSVQGRAGLLPHLELTGEQAWERHWLDSRGNGDSQYGNQTLAQLRLTQPLWHPQLWHTFQEGQLAATRAEVVYESARQQLHHRLILAYLDILKSQVRLKVTESRLNAVKAQHAQAESRHRAGLTTRLESLQAEAELRRIQAERINIRGDVEDAYRQLEALVGVTVWRLAPLADTFDPSQITLPSFDELTHSGLARSAAVQQSELALQQSAVATKRALAAHQPTLDFTLMTSQETNDIGHPRAVKVDRLRLALQLNMPLYTGGRVASTGREARHRQSEAAELLRAQISETRQQIERHHRQWHHLQESISAATSSLHAQQMTLAASERGYEAGVQDTVDVLQAQRAVFDARLVLEEYRLDAIQALTSLKLATGQLDLAFVLQLNEWMEVSHD